MTFYIPLETNASVNEEFSFAEHHFRVDLTHLASMYRNKEPIASLVLTNDYGARLAEAGGVEVVVAAFSEGGPVDVPNEKSATLSDAISSVLEIRRANHFSFLVGDIPMSCYESEERIVQAAEEILNAGADAVKIEGGKEISQLVKQMSDRGIPVVGHIGYMPKTGMKMRVRGGSLNDFQLLLQDAKELIDAGVKALVLELIREDVATFLTRKVSVPTIGVYSGGGTSGQALVLNDLLDITIFDETFFPKGKPKSIGSWEGNPRERVELYRAKVKDGRFPCSVRKPVETTILEMWSASEGNHYQ